MKKLLSLLLTLTLVITTAASCGGEENPGDTPTPNDKNTSDASEYLDRDVTGRNVAYVSMEIKNYGTVKLLLDATSAPRTVANFLTLAKSGFYNGLDFYSVQRLSSNQSVIFGGDPTIASSKGDPSPDTITGEFSYNGIQNDLEFKRGVIAMFHSKENLNDASSAFFFTNNDIPNLNGSYAPFGYVISGYQVIEEIVQVGIFYTENGYIPNRYRPIISSVKVEQDIDYSLVGDVYVTPPTDDEVTDALGGSRVAKRTEIDFAPNSIVREYMSGDNYVFQMTGRIGNEFANILLGVNKQGKILGTVALDLTAESISSQLSSLVGLDLAGVEALDISSELKTLVKTAFRTVSAIYTDASASKYLYVRDIEGHETYTVEMKVQGYDKPVVILLDKTTAPITVANFISLVEKGFYDGLSFHRIIKGFMIQGGSYDANWNKKDTETIKGEFATNGYNNDIKHLRGTISMARTTLPDSASSGFFICDATTTRLDGEYAAFGYVISGMETVDAIAAYDTTMIGDNGFLLDNAPLPTIEYIKIVEN